MKWKSSLPVGLALLLAGLQPSVASAHCDALDGPVVKAARLALERNDVSLALPWVPRDAEKEVRAAFARTRAVRGLGAEAMTLADTWFFETVVRIHRAAEGAPFDGLKPAGHIEPFVAAVDRSLETGSAEAVIADVTGRTVQVLRELFARARDTRARAGESVEAGREHVAAYVAYLHYVEALHLAASGAAEHGHSEALPDAGRGARRR